MDPLHYTIVDGDEHHHIPEKYLDLKLIKHAKLINNEPTIDLHSLDAEGIISFANNREIHKHISEETLHKLHKKWESIRTSSDGTKTSILASHITKFLFGR